MKITLIALLVALAGATGSLYLSLGLGLKACPLCFYQRAFVMGTAAVLIVGLVADRSRAGLLCLVCVPLALGGLGVAGFHEFLVIAGVLECPKALFGLGTAPVQSLAVFFLLAAAVTAGAWKAGGKRALGLAVVTGIGMAWGSVASAPPLPPAPKAPYDAEKQPLDICRPPYRAS
jgi:hypothetical protein